MKQTTASPDDIKQAKLLKKLIEEVNALEEKVKEAKAKARKMAQEMATSMSRRGLKNFAVEGFGSVYIATEFYPEIKDPAALEAFLKKDKEGKHLFKMTIPGNTRKAFLVERYKQGGKLPSSDVVDIAGHIESLVRIRSEKEASSKAE